ncbi:MAG TPA: hypothetical protein VK108_04200 [Pseudogracilibacillus sp.]|nr:hypothetical protein [Pseudogracilibacillus sp.]
MKKLSVLTIIGVIAGVFLAVFLRVMQQLTGSQAYILLFNVDYIPILNALYPASLIEAAFHFGTCVASTIFLYYFFRFFHLEKKVIAYAAVVFMGSGILYFLTVLSPYTPPITDVLSWVYWVIGHIIFSVIIGGSIKKWL